MTNPWTILLWFSLNILIGLTMDFALFTQTTEPLKSASLPVKLLSSEFWASIEWMFLIPANRIGNRFLTAPQLSLASYVFDFIAQILSNSFWLHLPTTADDYMSMCIILFGMAASKFAMFG